MADITEVGKGEHGHPRLHIEEDRHLPCQDGDLRQVLGAGLDIDRGVGKEQGPVFRDHQIETGDLGDPRPPVDDLEHRTNGVGIGIGDPVDLAIHHPFPDQHGPEDIGVPELPPHLVHGPAPSLAQGKKFVFKGFQMLIMHRVDDLDARKRDLQAVGNGCDLYLIPQQHRLGNPVTQGVVGRPDDHRQAAFGQDNAFGVLLGAHDDLADQLPFRSQGGLQLVHINGPFRQGYPGHTACHRGLGHRRHHL